MVIPEDLKVTDDVLYRGALLFILIDLVIVTLLVKRIKPDELLKMKWTLVVVMFIFFFVLFGAIISIIFWDSVYSYVFPIWARWVIPPLYGLLFSLVGLLTWWVSFRLPANPVLYFCIMGGLWGIVSHILAIHRGILEKPPMLQGSSPLAALTIAAFEFVFYWCICLILTRFISGFRSGSKIINS